MNRQRISIPLIALAAVALLAALLVFGRFCSSAATIDVTVNDASLTIHGAKTMQTAIRESGLPVNPGDLISLEGTVLKKSEGYPFSATVNGEETTDPEYQLHAGDVIVLADGEDRVEEYDSIEEALPHSGVVGGNGAICAFEHGYDGAVEVRTGRLSGDVSRHIVREEVDTTCMSYNPDVGDDKVIALTFDDGPSERYTSDVLDVLRDNDARATFFCKADKVEDSPHLVQRERSEGHQVCTKVAVGDADDAESLAKAVDYGMQAISAVLGGEAPSRIVRLQNTTLNSETVVALDPYVEATAGWNADTGDWVEGDSDQVYRVLMSVEPGDIVLLRDGGGDRSATVEALGRSLPRLKKMGYSFVTMDDLMGYPAQ